jgi:predicted ATPase
MSRPVSSAPADRPVRVDFRNQGADSAIVFVHGFGGHAAETWGDFPRFLMERSDLGDWDVFGIGYSSSLRIDLARVWTADPRLDTLGYYLRTTLALPPLDRYKRVALVAHSMGGLIAQQALLDERCRSRISHVFLFGTPSAGLGRASFVRSLKQQTRDLHEGGEFITRLRSAWNAMCALGEPFAMCVVAGERDAFVPTTSSLEPFPDSVRFVVPGDHLTMIKPMDAGSLSVQLVAQALTGTVAASAPPSRRSNLPRQLSQFIGREKEIAEIKDLVADTQLLTIVGPGGIGKTRTALEAASAFLDCMPDGVWFVDLAPLSDPALVTSAIAGALSIEDKGSSRALIDTVALALQDKTLLIILDNCEHLVAAAAEAADRILRGCPGVRMMVTTREALAIAGETTLRMPVLSISEGVALFAERAKAADSSFTLTESNQRIVEGIVERLDGIALAIELAAPRVKVLGVDQLAKRLDHRLNVLAGGSRTALPRQQTLRALIGWSYDLLNEAERLLLRQLAVFRGSFTLDALTHVCQPPGEMRPEWDELSLLSSLIDKSLVATQSGDDLRYRLLESTREYALERLDEDGESENVLLRHCRYFVSTAASAYEEVWSTSLDSWLAHVRADLENYRAAIDWGLGDGHDPFDGASITANLLHLWEESLTSEGRRLLERAEIAVPASASEVLRGRIQLAIAALASQDMPELRKSEVAVTTLAGTDDRASYAHALLEYGRNLARTGKMDEAVRSTEAALAVARSLSHPHLTARILASLGAWYGWTGRPNEGLRALDEAASILHDSNDRRRIIIVLANTAELKFAHGDVSGAISDALRGLTISGEAGPENDLDALFHANLAAYFLGANELTQAWLTAREALALALRIGGRRTVNIALQHLAHVAAKTGDLKTAARIIGRVDAMFAAINMVREPTEKIGYERMTAVLREGLASDRLSSLMAAGAASEERLIVAEALAIPKP